MKRLPVVKQNPLLAIAADIRIVRPARKRVKAERSSPRRGCLDALSTGRIRESAAMARSGGVEDYREDTL